MDCTDKYSNLQPSTNDIHVVCHLNERSLKHYVHYKSEVLQLPPFFYLCDTTKHFLISQWFLKGEAKAKSACSPVLGSLRYEKAQIIHVLAVTKEI